MGRAAWAFITPPHQKQYQMSSLSDMLSSEIATLRAQAAALLSKAAALESALNALAPVAVAPVAEAPVAVAPVAEAAAEPEAPKVKKAPHAWACFLKRACAILKAAGYTGTLDNLKALWHQSHEWADADIVPAWLAFKAQAEAVASAFKAEAAAGGGATAAEAAPAEPKPKKRGAKKFADMTPEEKEAAHEKRKAKRAAKTLLRHSYLEGMKCLTNDRGDVVSEDGEWLGHWTGHAIDSDAPIPADFDELALALE